jgi:aspartate-semialdehyde dehydrogenase
MTKITVIGSSGLVGKELTSLLEKNHYNFSTLDRVTLPFHTFEKNEVVFLCVPCDVAKSISFLALEKGAFVIDLGSTFRLDPDVPLIIPELNKELLSLSTKLIASPNCVATLLNLLLFPLHKAYQVTSALICTYQAASGAGKLGLDALLNPGSPSPFPHPYKHNLFLHESEKDSDLYSLEERKIIDETKKILNARDIQINARSVRVPVIRSHSIYANVTFACFPKNPDEILKNCSGILFHEDPTPELATGRHEVLYGPIRRDLSKENSLDLWITGDQLLKGAALNGLQIMQSIFALSLKDRSLQSL